jgi:hypothetical protein
LGAGAAQSNPKSAALANLRLDARATAHPFGGFCHHGQPDSCAFVTCGRCALEDSKNALPVLWLNTNAVVFHENRNLGVFLYRANYHLRRSVAGNKPNSVRE